MSDLPDYTTFGAILKNGGRADCWCPACQQVTAVDLALMVQNGMGDKQTSVCRPSCGLCGKDGHWYIGRDTGQPFPPPPVLDLEWETSEDPPDLS